MNAILSILYADVPGFPAGSVVATISATLTGATTITQTGAPGAVSIEFANVAADTYAYSVVAEDASGNKFGSPVMGTIVITAPATVTLSLPSTVSATQT